MVNYSKIVITYIKYGILIYQYYYIRFQTLLPGMQRRLINAQNTRVVRYSYYII